MVLTDPQPWAIRAAVPNALGAHGSGACPAAQLPALTARWPNGGVPAASSNLPWPSVIKTSPSLEQLRTEGYGLFRPGVKRARSACIRGDLDVPWWW